MIGLGIDNVSSSKQASRRRNSSTISLTPLDDLPNNSVSYPYDNIRALGSGPFVQKSSYFNLYTLLLFSIHELFQPPKGSCTATNYIEGVVTIYFLVTVVRGHG